MKALKKWIYPVLLLAFGIFYMTYVDGWDTYRRAAARIGDALHFCEGKEGAGSSEETAHGSGDGGENGAEGIPWTEIEAAAGTDDNAAEENESGIGETGGGSNSAPESSVTEEPVFTEVEDAYFADAVFIGDSRTVGLQKYGELTEIASFYASTGLTVYKLFDAPIVQVPGQREKITIEEALTRYRFGKIYLMIGINEMGVGTVETFTEKYAEVLEHLKELQPDAIIYVQAIMKVTKQRSEKGDYITNEGIEERNRELEKLADNKTVFFLDVNPVLCDETGGLPEDYTTDGVHLLAKYVGIWKDFIKTHGILRDNQ